MSQQLNVGALSLTPLTTFPVPVLAEHHFSAILLASFTILLGGCVARPTRRTESQ